MFCKDCGKEMKDGTTLCPECGTKTESSNVKQVSNEMPVSDTNMSVIAPEMSKKKVSFKTCNRCNYNSNFNNYYCDCMCCWW